MGQRITRRVFAKAGAAATLGLTSLEATGAVGATQPGTVTQPPAEAKILEVRPYQLMCIVCRIGEGRTTNLGEARLTEILAAARKDCAMTRHPNQAPFPGCRAARG